MKYKIMVDVSFTDKLDETIHYQPGDIIETKVDEKRKENIVARGLGHVVEEITEEKPKTKGKEKSKKEEVEPTTDEIVEETTEEVEPTTDEK